MEKTTEKCARCGKELKQDSLNGNNLKMFKTCDLCRTKRKADYALVATQKELDKKGEKLLQSLDVDLVRFPDSLKSYSKYVKFIVSIGGCKPNYESYENAVKEAKYQQGLSKADNLNAKFRERRKYNSKFLNFDLHGFSDKEKCKAYRFSIMEGKTDPRLTAHIEDSCTECKLWKNSFDNGTLNAEYTSEIWNAEQKPFLEPLSYEDKFGKWEREQGLVSCCGTCGSSLITLPNGKVYCLKCNPEN